jgi:hypothetical protein
MSKILLQKENNYTISEEVDIILSAELYSARIFDIPIESSKELKLVIPDFFEEFFNIEGYSFYYVKLSKHKYLCFAYKQDDILEIIKKSNIDLKYVKNIYFLQNELKCENDNVYEYNKTKYICSNDILVKIPDNISVSTKANKIDLNNITLSKHNIFFNKSSKYIENKTAYIISFIFIIFAIFNFYKMSILNTQIDNYDKKLDGLKQKYSIPSSMIQTKAIIGEYEEVKNNYEQYRTALEYILNYNQSINTKLEDIEYKNNKLLITFENKNKEKLEKYIKKRYKIISSHVYNNNLSIEVKI